MRWVWLGWSGRREGDPSTLQENRAHRQTRVLRCHHHRLFGRVPRSGRARGSSPWQLAPGRSAGAGPALASVRGRQRWLPSPGSSPGTASLAGQELGLVALGSREAVRPRAARRPPPPHHWARVGDVLPRAGGPGDGVTPWNQLGPRESPQGDETLGRKAGSRLPRALPGREGWRESTGLAPSTSPSPGVLPVVTGYASAVQCPPVLSGCSAAAAAQGTVCEQTSGQSLAAAKESNQRSKGEQGSTLVPGQSRAGGGRTAGGAGRAGMQAEPLLAPPPSLRLPIPAGLNP